MPQILLIDDDEAFRTMLATTLRLLGHDVVEARDGKKAAPLFSLRRFDVVMTDIIMPEKDGLEIIGELTHTHPGLKIVAMSGGGRMSGTDYLKMARSLGAHGILNKPFSQSEIVALLTHLLALPA